MATDYVLSIVIYGPGTDPNHRSHWAFAIHRKTAESGVLLHVQLIDLSKLIYQYDERRGVDVRSRSSEGSFAVAPLTNEQVQQAVKIIREEQAPNDGGEVPRLGTEGDHLVRGRRDRTSRDIIVDRGAGRESSNCCGTGCWW